LTRRLGSFLLGLPPLTFLCYLLLFAIDICCQTKDNFRQLQFLHPFLPPVFIFVTSSPIVTSPIPYQYGAVFGSPPPMFLLKGFPSPPPWDRDFLFSVVPRYDVISLGIGSPLFFVPRNGGLRVEANSLFAIFTVPTPPFFLDSLPTGPTPPSRLLLHLAVSVRCQILCFILLPVSILLSVVRSDVVLPRPVYFSPFPPMTVILSRSALLSYTHPIST